MHVENTLWSIPEGVTGRTRCGDNGRASVREREEQTKTTPNNKLPMYVSNTFTPPYSDVFTNSRIRLRPKYLYRR